MARGQSQQHLRGRTEEQAVELDQQAGGGEQPGQQQEDPTIVRGGPGQGQEEQQGAAWQPFKYGDKTFGSEKELTDYLGDLDRQLQEARKPPPSETPPPKPAGPQEPTFAADGIDWDTEFYKNPKDAARRFEQALTKKITDQLTTQYQADSNMRSFWEQFYKEFPDMEKRAQVAGMVLQRDWKELSEMKLPDCRRELNKRTLQQLQDWGAAPERPAPTTHRTTVEGGTVRGGARPGTQQAPQSQADKPPASLSAMIRQRAEQRRQAAGNRTQVS